MKESNISADKLMKLLSSIALELSFCEESFENSLNKVLKMIGEELDVSRVYIFEDSEDGQYTSNTHEWCASNVTAQKDNLQEIVYEELPSFIKSLDETGKFIANDVSKLDSAMRAELEPQEIKSILIFQLIYGGKKRGFIGLDEIRDIKEWNETEVELLKTISFLISSTFMRSFAKRKVEAKLNDVQKMNDIMVSRELKMVELKRKLEAFEKENKI